MYLKCIEIHGFKSFANKMILEFHNGITGIVGPNGSGKSNVGDAVRWVLGEQSAKQLRGSSMQDVIFSGTENRKPVSYAYVAITLDNSDHQLATDYEEVTVARRVYRSGESEYLLNGSPCRLKDVAELFYDTGIGKEGYSIIGQGQIDQILSGKPEERRELFDEAAGIVKFKRRKTITQKKLQEEQDNLVRVNDILSELERQVGPLEAQSEKARKYLNKKEELKKLDLCMFIQEQSRLETEHKELSRQLQDVQEEQEAAKTEYAQSKMKFERMETTIAAEEHKMNEIRDQISEITERRSRMEGEINVLKEQIHTAETTDEHYRNRLLVIEAEKEKHEQERNEYQVKIASLEVEHQKIQDTQAQAEEEQKSLQEKITAVGIAVEQEEKELRNLLNDRASIKAEKQHFETVIEQVNIQKARITQKTLENQSGDENLVADLAECKKRLADTEQKIAEATSSHKKLEEKSREWKQKLQDVRAQIEEARTDRLKLLSHAESLSNIAERYDGYGNSIQKVMEQRETCPGILGVVSDLIQVDKKFETAIEIALGGSIRNIVTDEESTAKKMIAFLKENRYGRATFLPLTSVTGKNGSINGQVLQEAGVIGIAGELISYEAKYAKIVDYLLGKVLVVDEIDHAIQISKKNHYSLNIVTLDGESIRPGGSMTGGAFRNSGNLLGRKREIEEYRKQASELEQKITEMNKRQDEIVIARSLNQEELEEVKSELQNLYLEQNTAKLNHQKVTERCVQQNALYEELKKESAKLEEQLLLTGESIDATGERLACNEKQELEWKKQHKQMQEELEEWTLLEKESNEKLSEIRLQELHIRQNVEFMQENCQRLQNDMEKLDNEAASLKESTITVKNEAESKHQEILRLQEAGIKADQALQDIKKEFETRKDNKERFNQLYKGLISVQEEIASKINLLDKEIYRLDDRDKKVQEAADQSSRYMWEEYEITLHAAMEEIRDATEYKPAELKKRLGEVKNEIRALGDVNVNAIEEYKEVSQRYYFLKNQHEDLISSEQALQNIIQELDNGMRKQFSEKFEDIRKEFDHTFRLLFGGGHGNLELVEGEDLLECGILIIAQPPGKKLQNMMQMSGGEKALTAIALLFAIQALKPSPFCLLDEIEAALDDSNVGRFANYLKKLTNNTQFIVITHRRGTMIAADRLYGITMQEKGVSALVSVDLIESELN